MLSSGARQRRENKAYPPGLDRNNSKFAQRTTAFMRKQSFFVSMCWSVSKSVDAIQALSRFIKNAPLLKSFEFFQKCRKNARKVD